MIRKILAIAVTGVLTITLAACGNSSNQTEQITQESTSAVETEPVETTVSESTEETVNVTEGTEVTTDTDIQDTDGGDILIAYFSWSGNTQELAEMIQQNVGGDIFVIEPETPYTSDYNEVLDVAQQEQSDNARPALASQVENWDDYDTVFVGYPNWWGSAPMIILSFLEEYDCTGKTIIPFCTSGGGGFGDSLSKIEESAAGAVMAEGFHISGSRVGSASGDVASWLEGLNLTE